MPARTSTQARSPGKPGKSRANRSLERGVAVLRAFKAGTSLLGNGELAERTGLSRSTVTRLTQTLVGCGLLQVEPGTRVYRLAPVLLSFAHAMRSGSRVLTLAAPLMREYSERYKVNVGLAAPDLDEMVYLESIRYSRRPSLRTVVSGQRVPMELTSLGRAYLAAAGQERRSELLAHFRRIRKSQWRQLESEIHSAIESIHSKGFCSASWQPEVVALATPILDGPLVYVLNVSVSSAAPTDSLVSELEPVLMDLKKTILAALNTSPAAPSTTRV